MSADVPNLFITIFNHPWGEVVQGGGAKEAWLDLQLAVLHMIGGVLCSSMVTDTHIMSTSHAYPFPCVPQANRELACSERVCLLLLTLFDPREKCTPIQVLTTKVFIKLVHVLHASVYEVRGREGREVGGEGEGVRECWFSFVLGPDRCGFCHDAGDLPQHPLLSLL